MLEPSAQQSEREQTYRRAATVAFLCAGLLSLALAGAMLNWQRTGAGRNLDAGLFFFAWLLVFLVAGSVHFLLMVRGAHKRSDPAFRTRFRQGYAAIWPSAFAGIAICACLQAMSGLALFSALFLVIFYGLGLLSLRHLARPSIGHLGWAFLLTGTGAFIYLMNETVLPDMDLPMPTNYWPATIMGGTFGLYHVLYAVCTWPRSVTAAQS